MTHYASWPLDRIARLRQLWTAGKTAREIGMELFASRNAVIGKLHRLGLLKNGIPHPKIKRERKKPSPRLSVPSLPTIRAKQAPVPKAIPMLRTAPRPGTTGILDVTGCRFATGFNSKVAGGHTFCNDERHGESPWCPYHYNLVYQVRPNAA